MFKSVLLILLDIKLTKFEEELVEQSLLLAGMGIRRLSKFHFFHRRVCLLQVRFWT